MLFNDISLTRYDIRRCHMRCLLRKHDIISVPSYAEGIYHPPKVDIISKIYHPFRKERISLKKVTFVGRQKWLFSWSRIRESNPPSRLGKPLYYRYTNPAYGCIIAKGHGKSNHFLSKGLPGNRGCGKMNRSLCAEGTKASPGGCCKAQRNKS